MANDRERMNEDMENPEAGRSRDDDLIGRADEGDEEEFEDVDEGEDDSEDLDDDV